MTKDSAALELEFDDDLRGMPGREIISVDARRKWYGRVERQPDPGQNLVLTIDGTIQYIAEKELEQAMLDTKAEAGTVVVQNPRTGEILALANRPTFNPNVFNSVAKEALKNRAVSDVYEPGSVFKTVTYSAAIEQGVVKPEDTVDCQGGAITIFGMTIHDAHKMGVMTIAEAYAHSSDVAAVKTGMKLGDERFDEYIRSYGFGAQTGIELPGREPRAEEAGQSLVEGVDRRHVDGPGNRCHRRANRVHGFDHCQRRRLHTAAHRGR